MLIATTYINVIVISLNNSGTAEIDTTLLIVILLCIRLSNTRVEKKIIQKSP